MNDDFLAKPPRLSRMAAKRSSRAKEALRVRNKKTFAMLLDVGLALGYWWAIACWHWSISVGEHLFIADDSLSFFAYLAPLTLVPILKDRTPGMALLNLRFASKENPGLRIAQKRLFSRFCLFEMPFFIWTESGCYYRHIGLHSNYETEFYRWAAILIAFLVFASQNIKPGNANLFDRLCGLIVVRARPAGAKISTRSKRTRPTPQS